jgi:hypothetical protein
MFVEGQRRPVRSNVILAVDTTATPAATLQSLELELNHFSESLASNWIELRLVVLARQQAPGVCVPAPLGSGACAPQGTDSLLPALFHHPSAVVDDANALQVIIEEYPVFSPYLDPTAESTVVVVTGGDATASLWNDPETFVQAYTALTNAPWRMAGYYPFSPCLGIPGEGRVYRDIVGRTGGVHADICSESPQAAFERIAASIYDRVLPCAFLLPDPGPGRQIDYQQLNVNLRAPGFQQALVFVGSADGCDGVIGGWYYDNPAAPTGVFLCPESCVLMRSTRDSQLEVVLGCPTINYPGRN